MSLGPTEADSVLRQARRCGLSGLLTCRLATESSHPTFPSALKDRLDAAAVLAAEYARRIRWEIHQVRLSTRAVSGKIVLLKGAAYLLAGFPNAEGRFMADLDLLVAEAELPEVEQALLAGGWRPTKQDAYDQRYYREWMHELPPFVHPIRGVEVDLHHNISPRTSRLKVDAAELLREIVPLDEEGKLFRLSDRDIVLHLCVHLFHDGDMDNGLRELVDLDGLLRTFAADPGYWDSLTERAEALGLTRPLGHGLHFAAELLETPVPDHVRQWAREHGIRGPARPFLHACMGAAMLPVEGDEPTRWRRFSVGFLYLRSHWLRMPFGLLVRHLWHQARRRGGLKTAESARLGG